MSSPLTPPRTPFLDDEESVLTKTNHPYNSFKNISNQLYQIALGLTHTLQTFLPRASHRQNQSLRRTAYLDGLRGFSAFLVYILHHEVWAHESLKSDQIFENGFGYQGKYYFAQLPGIRLFLAGGHFSVAIFFVISGYVLSAKPLAFVHNKNFTKLGDNLASALFRRWIRLYIPVIATTFIYMNCAFFIRGLETNVHPESRYLNEFWRWYADIKGFSFIFRTGGVPWMIYNFHVWTIPLEFKGSIVIYTSILAFSRCTRRARIWLQVGLIIYFMYIVDGWYCSCFIAGMLLVDFDLMAEGNQLPSLFTKLEPYKSTIFYTLLIIAIYLGGVPAYGIDIANVRDAPGWYFLSYLIPSAVYMPKSFYLFWAGVFLVAAIPRIPWLKAFFELPANQYLGKVSYAFYLIHGPILWTIGNRVYAAVGWARADHSINIPGWVGMFRLPKFGPVGLEFNFLCVQLILFPLTLWVAKLATNAFDEPAIKLAAWLYERVRIKDEDTEKYQV